MADKIVKLKDHHDKRQKNGRSNTSVSKDNVRNYDPGAQIRRLKCYPEVDQMVRQGSYVKDVVTYIHGEGELTHLSAEAVGHIVMRYKRHVFSDHMVEDSGDVIKKIGDLDKDNPASVVFALQEMYYLMMDRIRMESETEKTLNKLFSTTHKEFMTMTIVGRELLKFMKEFDMMNSTTPLSQKSGSFPGGVDVGGVATNPNPESRQKLLGILGIVMNNPDMLSGMLDKVNEGEKKSNRPKRKKTK